MKVCEARKDHGYEQEMRSREDFNVLQIIGEKYYRDSTDPGLRYWYRLALMEARRRGLET